MDTHALLAIVRCTLEGGLDAIEALAKVRRAERRDLQCASAEAGREGIEPQARQRMLQKRDRLGRGKMRRGGVDDEIEESARRCLAERAAGGVVHLDAPGFEADGNAAREKTIGRNECRRLAGESRPPRAG